MTPAQCARRCEALIVRLLPPEERDKYRVYTATEIAKVLNDDTKSRALLTSLEREMHDGRIPNE